LYVYYRPVHQDFGLDFLAKVNPVKQCFSTFLLQQNPTQACRSLTEPHALIRESSDVQELRLISLAGQSPMETTKQAKMTNYNMKFDCISRQQYVIVFNQTRLHDGRGGRRRPFSLATNSENLSRRHPQTDMCLFNLL